MGEVADDGEAEAGAGGGFVGADAALQDLFAHRWGQAGAVVVNRYNDRRVFLRACQSHLGLCPFAGVVEQVAEHFFEVFALAANEVVWRDIDFDCEAASGVNFL